MLANLLNTTLLGQDGKNVPIGRQVVDEVQQGFLAVAQLSEDAGLLVEEVVDQVRSQHGVVRREKTPMRNLDVGQFRFAEIVMQVAVVGLAGVGLAHGFRGVLEIDRGTNGWRAIDEVVVLDDVGGQPLEEEQRLVHLDVARIDRDDEVAGIEEGRAVFVHELHEREKNGSPRSPEARMNGEGGHLGDIAFLFADAGQVENALEREADGTFTDQ